jgi:hypothetical protein
MMKLHTVELAADAAPAASVCHQLLAVLWVETHQSTSQEETMGYPTVRITGRTHDQEWRLSADKPWPSVTTLNS